MRPRWWTDDDELLAELRTAVHSRAAVPQAMLDAALAAFTWRAVDAELAELLYDSLVDEPLAVTRSASDTRILAFQGDHIGAEIEISEDAVRGQLLPPQPGRVVLLTADGHEYPATADEVGCFTVPTVPSSPFRLRCGTAGDAPIVTDWVLA
jgi:hypothetical protein